MFCCYLNLNMCKLKMILSIIQRTLSFPSALEYILSELSLITTLVYQDSIIISWKNEKTKTPTFTVF
jgi:hypothetical protein